MLRIVQGMETMVNDMPPKDEEILDLVRKEPAGISADALIRALLARDYGEREIIDALQRVLERGKVDFSPDALLVAAPEIAQAA